jgi:membrane-associated HD superfamily phosphohydrolase
VAYERAVSPIDAAFTSDLPDEARTELLTAVLPGLTDEARTTLLGLPPERWEAERDEGARVLDQIERTELRDTDIAITRRDLASRMVADLSPEEQALAAEIVSPLLVPNSSYSQALTEEAGRRNVRSCRPARRSSRTR